MDPAGLKGLHLRARAGPVREAFLRDTPDALRPVRKIPPTIADTQLFGGIDIPGTLAEGQVVRARGLLADPRRLMLTMAERCPPGLAARLSQALDSGDGHCLILLDEGVADGERAPHSLTERLAFSLEMDGLRAIDLAEIALESGDIEAAQACCPG